jgi:hypothetical protein
MNPTRNRLNLNPMNRSRQSRNHPNRNQMNRSRLNLNRMNRTRQNQSLMNRSHLSLNPMSLIRMNRSPKSPSLMSLNLNRNRSNPNRNHQNPTPMSRSLMSLIRTRQMRLRHSQLLPNKQLGKRKKGSRAPEEIVNDGTSLTLLLHRASAHADRSRQGVGMRLIRSICVRSIYAHTTPVGADASFSSPLRLARYRGCGTLRPVSPVISLDRTNLRAAGLQRRAVTQL